MEILSYLAAHHDVLYRFVLQAGHDAIVSGSMNFQQEIYCDVAQDAIVARMTRLRDTNRLYLRRRKCIESKILPQVYLSVLKVVYFAV